LDKIIEVSKMLSSKHLMTLEPSVQIITPGTSRGLSEKVASEAASWARQVTPEPGKTFILVLALGASEYYGPNRNGDGFKDSELRKSYKTFEDLAHVYMHHKNKDPEKSVGSVVKSFYNPDMRRVELILKLDNKKAPDVADKIAKGQTVAVSMGCRIKKDVCSICGHEAANRSQYCDHAKFQMNDILPDGRIVFVDNPSPKFFDISIVWRPADKTGYMLKKVAYDMSQRDVGEPSTVLAEKLARKNVLSSYIQKAADIDKIVQGIGFGAPQEERGRSLHSEWLKHIVPKIVSDYKPLANRDLKWLSGKSFPKVLKALSSMGILLTTPEFLNLFFMKTTGKPAPEGAADKLVALQGDIFDLMANHPELTEVVVNSGVLPEEGETKEAELLSRMGKYYSSRSLEKDNLLKKSASITYTPMTPRLSEYMNKARLEGDMATLTYTDPNSGKVHYTDRGSARAARSARKEQAKLLGSLGAAAMSLIAYRGLRGLGRARAAAPVGLIGGSTGLGIYGATTAGKKIRTDQGVLVDPSLTFNVKQGSAKLSLALSIDYARNGSIKTASTSNGLRDLVGSSEDLDFNFVAQSIGRAILE
jgi:hypothetical protein